MIRFPGFFTPFDIVPLADCVEVLDRLRRPVNVDERRSRTGGVPYYGANGQVGWIDEWIFDEELVLVAEDGGFFDDPHRPISYRVSGKAWVNNHAHVLRPANGVDVDWLNFSIAFQDVTRLTKGATRQKLNQQDLRQIRIPLPPLGQQRRIVSRIKACLQRVSEIEGLRAEALQEAAAITPSLLNDVFVGVATRAPSKSIEEVTLETRYGTSQKCYVEASGVPILRIPNVAAGSVNFDDLKYCRLSDEELRRIQLVPGDLLFVRTNGSRDLVGRCAVFEPRRADEPVGFASYLIRVRLDPQRVLPRYLAYFLNSTKGREEIDQRRRTSAGQFNINSENLRSISFPVPPVQEQARLIAMMEERDQLASQLTGELRAAGSESAQLRESILCRAFAGEL